MKMWVQLWFENIKIKYCVINFIGAPHNEADRAFNSGGLYDENIRSCLTPDMMS